MKTVVGLFPSMAEAERVARDLEQMGIASEEINLVAGNEEQRHDEYVRKPETASSGAGANVSVGTGAAVGGGTGLVAGLLALAIPGVGPVIAGGALATALTGLGVGAVTGGLMGAFMNMGVSQDEAPLYEEAVRRGGVVVAVHVNDPIEEQATRIMDQHGARDMRAEADVWRASGWSGPSLGGAVQEPSDSSIRSREPAETVEQPKSGDYRSNVRSYTYDRDRVDTAKSSTSRPSTSSPGSTGSSISK